MPTNTLRLYQLPLTASLCTAQPTTEPLTLAEVKAHLRLRHASEDDFLMGLITTARMMAEGETRRAMLTQTWQLTLDQWPTLGCDEWWDGVREGPMWTGTATAVELPRPPLQSVVSVTTTDADDMQTVWPPTQYFVDTAREPGRLGLRPYAVEPIISRAYNGVRIEFVAGYTSPALIPAPLKHGMLMVVAELYRHRETSSELALMEVPYDAACVWRDWVVRL